MVLNYFTPTTYITHTHADNDTNDKWEYNSTLRKGKRRKHELIYQETKRKKFGKNNGVT